MTRALRSNFEAGTVREAARRAQWKALGLTDADIEKPKIAVVNSSSELAICFRHLDGVAAIVKEAMWAAGGLPFEIRTAAPSDFIISAGGSGGYILPSRDLVVNDMEIAVEGAQLDGMICLSSCDKTPPAHLMAAGRFNIPTILVICGYQPCGQLDGESVDIEDVFVGGVQVAFGKLDADRLRRDGRQRDPRAGRVPGDGDRELDARRRRGARHGAARQRAGARQQPEDDRHRAALGDSGSSRWCSRTSSRATS